jgi:hypothetical protein
VEGEKEEVKPDGAEEGSNQQKWNKGEELLIRIKHKVSVISQSAGCRNGRGRQPPRRKMYKGSGQNVFLG